MKTISINLLNLPGIGPALKKLLGRFGVEEKRCEDCAIVGECKLAFFIFAFTGGLPLSVPKQCTAYERKWWKFWRPK